MTVFDTNNNRQTMDKYATKALPPTTGFSGVTTNNGSFRNQGVEIDITGTILRTRDFSWTAGLNLTYNKNIVVDLPDNENINNRQTGTGVEVYTGEKKKNEAGEWYYPTYWIGGLQEGQEPRHILGYKNTGILQNEDQGTRRLYRRFPLGSRSCGHLCQRRRSRTSPQGISHTRRHRSQAPSR